MNRGDTRSGPCGPTGSVPFFSQGNLLRSERPLHIYFLLTQPFLFPSPHSPPHLPHYLPIHFLELYGRVGLSWLVFGVFKARRGQINANLLCRRTSCSVCLRVVAPTYQCDRVGRLALIPAHSTAIFVRVLHITSTGTHHTSVQLFVRVEVHRAGAVRWVY